MSHCSFSTFRKYTCAKVSLVGNYRLQQNLRWYIRSGYLSHHSNKEGENTTNAGNSHITNSGYSRGVQSVPQSEQPSTLSCESWQRWHLEEVLYSPRATVLDFDLEVLGLAFLQGKEEVFFLPAFLWHWRHSKTGTSLPVLRVQKPLTKKPLLLIPQQGKARKRSTVN